MKLKKHIENFEKLLTEQTTGATAALTGHYGRGKDRGKEVDDIFAGGFVATDSLKGDLTRQFNKRKTQRDELNLDDDNALPLGGFNDIETPELIATYQYWDEILQAKIEYNDTMTPEYNPNWELANYDDWSAKLKERAQQIEFERQEGENFINYSRKDFQPVGIDIKYDKIEDKTEENKKFINDTSDWKSIYDDKKY